MTTCAIFAEEVEKSRHLPYIDIFLFIWEPIQSSRVSIDFFLVFCYPAYFCVMESLFIRPVRSELLQRKKAEKAAEQLHMWRPHTA